MAEQSSSETFEIKQTDEGILFRIKAIPNARKNEIRGIWQGALRIAVTQVAEKGKANQAIVVLLAKHLGIAKSNVVILSGHASKNKTLLIKSLGSRDLLSRLPI